MNFCPPQIKWPFPHYDFEGWVSKDFSLYISSSCTAIGDYDRKKTLKARCGLFIFCEERIPEENYYRLIGFLSNFKFTKGKSQF